MLTTGLYMPALSKSLAGVSSAGSFESFDSFDVVRDPLMASKAGQLSLLVEDLNQVWGLRYCAECKRGCGDSVGCYPQPEIICTSLPRRCFAPSLIIILCQHKWAIFGSPATPSNHISTPEQMHFTSTLSAPQTT